MGKTTKKALVYSPYFETVGGGERYCLSVAEFLLSQGWQVDILWTNKKDILDIAKKLNLNLAKANVLGLKLKKLSFLDKFKLTKKYDFIFWLSNGAIPFLFGKKNVLHFQRPFVDVNNNKFLNFIKFRFIKKIVCNSEFTKNYIDQEFRVRSDVLYPPVDIEQFNPGKKENIILAVGRFEESFGAKRQDILVEAFKELVDEGLKDWRLVLIGGSLVDPKENKFLQKLKEQARNMPIEFLPNAGFKILKNYYKKAKLFWHAAGYGIDEQLEPWKLEHFGMTPVEAMAAGCVPIVIDKGGLQEIVRREVGERWRTIDELKEKTLKIINDSKLFKHYQNGCYYGAQKFSKSEFNKNLLNIIEQ